MSEKTQIYDTLSEEQKTVQIPYYLHEGEMTRLERLNKRWFISFLIVLAMLFITNAGWIIYESQYQTVTVSQAVDTGEGAAVVNGTGNANYGTSEAGDQVPGQEDGQQQREEAVPGV